MPSFAIFKKSCILSRGQSHNLCLIKLCGLQSPQSTFCDLRSEICSQQSAVCSLQSTVCSLQSAVCGLRSAVCGLRSAVCSLQSAVCSLQSAVCSLQSAVCSLQSAVCKCQTPIFAPSLDHLCVISASSLPTTSLLSSGVEATRIYAIMIDNG